MEKNDLNQTPSSMHLITCVVQRGKGDAIAKAAIKAGAGGATIYFARGIGTRERMGLLGLAIVPEKEVVLIVCKEDRSDRVLEVVTKAGSLDVPGMGIAYITPVLGISGHF
jgi:nitrogen regulatory protein PII